MFFCFVLFFFFLMLISVSLDYFPLSCKILLFRAAAQVISIRCLEVGTMAVRMCVLCDMMAEFYIDCSMHSQIWAMSLLRRKCCSQRG